MSVAGMGDGTEASADVRSLRRCINDVVGLSALSAIWANAPRSTIAESLADVVRTSVDAEVAYVGLRATPTGPACEGLSGDPADTRADEIRTVVATWLSEPHPPGIAAPVFFAGSAAVVTPIGIHAEHGVIVTIVTRADFPSATDQLLLNTAANQATVALLADRSREEQRIADVLQRIGSAVASELDTEKVVQAVTDEATLLTGASFGAFFYNVVNQAGESYMLYTLSGAPREAFARFKMPRATAIFAPTFTGASVVRLSDVTKDPRYGHNPPYNGMPDGHLPVRSYLAVPTRSRTGKVYGGLFLGHPDPGVFTERHERLAVGIAAWAALALDNASLYAEAQRANTAKDQFLATLSHELRTPLNALAGWLRMVRQPEVMRPGGPAKAWTAIDRNTEALTELVEDLLDVSRIATGKIRLADTDVDLNEVVRDSVRTMEPKFGEKGVTLAVDLAREPCDIRGDAARLRQITGNLLSNAVKFTAGGGRVSVTIDCQPGMAVLTVADTGIGIHPDFLPYLFDPFRQADEDSTSGLGLGLAIVKNLVGLHGGTVVAASDGIGCGAQFTVTLPRQQRRAGVS